MKAISKLNLHEFLDAEKKRINALSIIAAVNYAKTDDDEFKTECMKYSFTEKTIGDIQLVLNGKMIDVEELVEVQQPTTPGNCEVGPDLPRRKGEKQ